MNVTQSKPCSRNVAGDDAVRTDHYRILARLLSGPPSAGLLAAMQRIDPANVSSAALRRRWRELREAAAQADPSALEDEFQRLFVGLGRGEVIPYACRYLTGLLMDAPLVGLRSALASFGIVRTGSPSEPEDHAAVLCEVMALLCGPGEDPGSVQDFFDDYLASWLPQFFQDLQRAPSAGFYRSVGALGREFIDAETRHFLRPAADAANFNRQPATGD